MVAMSRIPVLALAQPFSPSHQYELEASALIHGEPLLFGR